MAVAIGRTAEVQRRVNRAAAPIEGIALCDEVAGSVERLQVAIASRSWQDVFAESGLLGRRALAYRQEFYRLAGALESER
jgi:hypothetical protein